MRYEAKDQEDYIRQLPDGRKEVIIKLRKTVLENIPREFQETMSYGTISYVVPKSVYPKGYHVDPKEPLPFISIASQKNHISSRKVLLSIHMGYCSYF